MARLREHRAFGRHLSEFLPLLRIYQKRDMLLRKGEEMTSNDEGQTVLNYHYATNHSVESVQTNNATLDFSILPRTYKLYRRLETVPLPETETTSPFSALKTLSTPSTISSEESMPTLADLSVILKLSAGITKWLKVPNGKMAFRAASCTGAMYNIELYVICADLQGLPAGVYQYGVHDNALRRIRSGDFRGVLTDATASDENIANSPLTIVYTSVFWRNAWKYQERAYRHAFWDGGTILANSLALAASRNLPSKVITGFVDETLNQLIDVDGVKEASLFLLPIGYAPSLNASAFPVPQRLNLETLPYSPQEINYPLIHSTHLGSSFTSISEVERWRTRKISHTTPSLTGNLTPLAVAPTAIHLQKPIEEVILQRGSTRRFQESSISYTELSTILRSATSGIDGDYIREAGTSLNDIYLIVNAVEGLSSGTYAFHRSTQELELLCEGEFREEAGHLGLNQALAHDAAVNVYFMANLAAVTTDLGSRGYRAAQLDASTTAGRSYLAAYSLGLGASGLTFFDDEVTDFLSPDAAGKSVMFLILLGVPEHRPGVAQRRNSNLFTPDTSR